MTEPIEVPTLARIRAALAAVELRPSRSFGQNFLTDPAILEALAESVAVAPGDTVLEVGPGPGTLTAVLLRRGARVVAVEVDPRMVQVLRRLLGRPESLELVEVDALSARPNLPPEVEAALEGAGAARDARAFKLVANLPYQIASALLVDLLWHRPPSAAAVTVQAEVAERMAAAAGTPQYGPLSVLVQLRAEVRMLRRLRPGAFWPPPNVDSACVRILPRAVDPAVAALPREALFRVVRGVFRGRRKTLANSLCLEFEAEVGRPALDAIVAEKNLGNGKRGESLAPMEIVALAARITPLLAG